jgi:formamidopyrimidine-DNA glycosylase
VPELPDLAILADAFHAGLAGRRIRSVDVRHPFVLRATPAEVAALEGQRLDSIRRRGKFLVFSFERDRLVVNAMLSGRFRMSAVGAAGAASAAGAAGGKSAGPSGTRKGRSAPRELLLFVFGPRDAAPEDTAPWTRGAEWIPPDDASVELGYRDATQMGRLYLVPAGVQRPVPGWDEQGPDADDPALTLEEWRRRIRRHPGELKGLLRNQAFVAGIGNAYSDEILHAARLGPFRKRTNLAPEEIDALYDATTTVLPRAVGVLRERVPPTFETEVRDFLAVHNKGGQACPRCGTRLTEVAAGGQATTFCRGCQL